MESKNINPWVQIWTHPRNTLRTILSTDPQKVIVWLAIIGGILSGLSFAALGWHFTKNALYQTFLILTMMIVGGLFGIALLYFFGWLYTLTGSWIGGKGGFTDLKCAVGWSNYPFIISNLLSFPRF